MSVHNPAELRAGRTPEEAIANLQAAQDEFDK